MASIRVWVIASLACLFFASVITAGVFLVIGSFQNSDVTLPAEPTKTPGEVLPASPAAATEASPTSSAADLSALSPAPSVRPVPSPSSSAIPSASPSEPRSSVVPELSSFPKTEMTRPPAEAGNVAANQQIPTSPTPSSSSPAAEAQPTPVVASPREEELTRKEVLQRIGLLRDLSGKEKDYLYAQVERARGFSKLAVVPFETGQLWPSAFQTKYLLENLQKPAIAKLFEDPTIVLVMVGYADLQGSPEHNYEISRTRADNVLRLLQQRAKITNLMRAVGIGGSDLFDKNGLNKNRVVEIWIVRP